MKKLGAHEHTYFYPCKTTMDIPKIRAKRFDKKEKKVGRGRGGEERGNLGCFFIYLFVFIY